MTSPETSRRWALAGLPVVLAASWALAQAGAERRSGYQDMGTALQKMQDDESSNPAMLFVQLGEQLWSRPAGAAGRACADCHSVAGMKGVAVRYPAIAGDGQPIDLAERIGRCRTEHQQAEPLAPESRDLLALEAFVARQSRGLPIAPPDDPRLASVVAEGATLWRTRQGQLNLSCAACHDDNAGRKLAGVMIPQGHPTAYPIYRLEWQTLGSLRRRLRNCLHGMRAETFPADSPAYISLAAYLMNRAQGMPFEAPGVRP
ncbi:sulfur oxidation c-type cytochrome SoxA [Reyranella sp.]|uniref:sulfur oxidation c-type cytochrome SoxA n=1 Tax=Reyranella sp. TaxID=1929291 RepID=UPI003BACDB9D